MRISVVMAACNAGPMLLDTVGCVRRAAWGTDGTEVIVVNDKSEDDVCNRLPPEVNLIEPEERVGCSGARHIGVQAASGDVVFICDPHSYLSPMCLSSLAREALAHEAIVIPFLKLEGKTDLPYFASVKLTNRGLYPVRFKNPQNYPALGGAMYAMSRQTLEKLRFLPPLPCWWGGFELFWSLVCYRLGVGIINHNTGELCVHRAYRDIMRLPYTIQHCGRAINEQWAMTVTMPMFYVTLLRHFCDRVLEDTEHKRQIEAWIQKDAVHPESWCMQWPFRLRGLMRDPLLKELLCHENIYDYGRV